MSSACKILSIDLETYSSVDLVKSGVYRYAEAPDFEILLLAYAYDDKPVVVVDLINEMIPYHVQAALTDPNVIKVAYNANFERVCLARWLGEEMPPEQWRCTMIHAATLGLPRSLGDVGRALGIPEDRQKMKEGKALVSYFCKPCKPTKSNGGRTRNMPYHDRDKWHTFMEYNRRDVEVERDIRKILDAYPVPEEEWAAWWLDQRINDRGILADMALVEAAIDISKEHSADLTDEASRLTGLENVNSVSQLKGWLGVDGSLDKKAVAALRSGDLPDDMDRVLAIRQELGKSSVSKYSAIRRSVCKDGRVHGAFQFYGANRTGRWCLTGDHEVLTDSGWQRLDQWQGGLIACWNATTEAVSFQAANALSFYYDGPMYTITDTRIDQVSTPDHKMRFQRRRYGEWATDTVENMFRSRPCIPFYGYRAVRPGTSSSKLLRVLVMVQADGHFTETGAVRLKFKKKRKIERCKKLLRSAGLAFVHHVYDDTEIFTIPAAQVPLWLRQFRDKTFGPWLLDENADVFFDELQYWDSYKAGPNSMQYSTTNKQNADMVQALAHMNGRSAVIKTKLRDNPNWNTAYYVDICDSLSNCHEIRPKPTITDYHGAVYCAETPTGFFLVRRNGKVWVTGNSGRLVQLQNLPQNHLPNLEAIRDIVKDLDRDALQCLYGNVPVVLSELIRTAFVAPEGHTLVVADFNAIEARVIAWLADEIWRQQVFANKGDIYCASASQMFGVPVEKNGVNGHLRQKGKIAELALGYGGGPGALTAMGALEMGLSEEELPGLVTAWREANPNIVALWWLIDKAAKETIQLHLTDWRHDLPHGLSMRMSRKMLHVRLPSGRELRYWKPYLALDEYGRENIVYGGMDAGRWSEVRTYGPKLVENIVQAISRDCLRDAMLSVSYLYPIIMHVHDEIVVEVPKEQEGEALHNMLQLMKSPVPWAPGLSLAGAGYACPFYQKD